MAMTRRVAGFVIVVSLGLLAGCSKQYNCTVIVVDSAGNHTPFSTLSVSGTSQSSAETHCAQIAVSTLPIVGGVGCTCTQQGTTPSGPDGVRRSLGQQPVPKTGK